MRTTLTIDPEIADRIKQELALGKRSLKTIINDGLRRGLGLDTVVPPGNYHVTPHHSPFMPGVDSGKLNQLVDELETGEFKL